MRQLAFVFGLASALVAPSVSAEPGQWGAMPYSSIAPFNGSPSCGDWIEENSDILREWALGFVNGMASIDAQVSSGQVDILSDQDANSIFASIDNVCRFNPQDTVVTAIRTVVTQILKQHAQMPSSKR